MGFGVNAWVVAMFCAFLMETFQSASRRLQLTATPRKIKDEIVPATVREKISFSKALKPRGRRNPN